MTGDSPKQHIHREIEIQTRFDFFANKKNVDGEMKQLINTVQTACIIIFFRYSSRENFIEMAFCQRARWWYPSKKNLSNFVFSQKKHTLFFSFLFFFCYFLLIPSTIFGNKKENKNERTKQKLTVCLCMMIEMVKAIWVQWNTLFKTKKRLRGKFHQLNGNRMNNGQVNTSQWTKTSDRISNCQYICS